MKIKDRSMIENLLTHSFHSGHKSIKVQCENIFHCLVLTLILNILHSCIHGNKLDSYMFYRTIPNVQDEKDNSDIWCNPERKRI